MESQLHENSPSPIQGDNLNDFVILTTHKRILQPGQIRTNAEFARSFKEIRKDLKNLALSDLGEFNFTKIYTFLKAISANKSHIRQVHRWILDRMLSELKFVVPVDIEQSIRLDPYSPTVRARITVITSILGHLRSDGSNLLKQVRSSFVLLEKKKARYDALKNKWSERMRFYRLPLIQNVVQDREERPVDV